MNRMFLYLSLASFVCGQYHLANVEKGTSPHCDQSLLFLSSVPTRICRTVLMNQAAPFEPIHVHGDVGDRVPYDTYQPLSSFTDECLEEFERLKEQRFGSQKHPPTMKAREYDTKLNMCYLMGSIVSIKVRHACVDFMGQCLPKTY